MSKRSFHGPFPLEEIIATLAGLYLFALTRFPSGFEALNFFALRRNVPGLIDCYNDGHESMPILDAMGSYSVSQFKNRKSIT